MGCLKLKVKQGEDINIGFTIKQDGEPMDIRKYTVHFQVKKVPLEKEIPIVDKKITTSSDENTIGIITDDDSGKFQVHLSKEDTSFNTGDYYLIISLETYDLEDNVDFCDIISSDCCNNAIYRICEQ